METLLDDIFWLSLALHADLVDDPQGLSHPLCAKAVSRGISPGRLHDFCRHVQKVRADNALQRHEAGGESGNSGLQDGNSLDESLINQNNLQSYDISEMERLNAKSLGVES